MKLIDAEKMLSDLMDQHLDDSWTYRFGNAVRLFGVCSYSTKTITISRPLVELNDENQVRDTILHEIAHALAGKGTHHGYKWRAIAIQIGCNGRRCYGSNVVKPKGKYLAQCNKCGLSQEYTKKMKRLACGRCCRILHNGKWNEEFLLNWVSI